MGATADPPQGVLRDLLTRVTAPETSGRHTPSRRALRAQTDDDAAGVAACRSDGQLRFVSGWRPLSAGPLRGVSVWVVEVVCQRLLLAGA